MKDQRPCLILPTEEVRPHLFKFLVKSGVVKWDDDELAMSLGDRKEILEVFLETLLEGIYYCVNNAFQDLHPIMKVRPFKYERSMLPNELAISLASNPFFRSGYLYRGEIVRLGKDIFLLKIVEDGNAWREAFIKETKKTEQLESELLALGKKYEELEEKEDLVQRVITLELENQHLFKDLKQYENQLEFAGVWREDDDRNRKPTR